MDHAMNQAVSFKLSDLRLKKPRCQMCCDETAEYIVCDGRTNGDIGSLKLWRLARSSRWGTLKLCIPKTPMNRRGKPVQVTTQQPWKTTLVFLGSCDQTCCSILNHCNLFVTFFCRRLQDQVAIIDVTTNSVNRFIATYTKNFEFITVHSEFGVATVDMRQCVDFELVCTWSSRLWFCHFDEYTWWYTVFSGVAFVSR